MSSIVWLLNFDADAELAQRKGAYSPTDPVRARSASLVAHVSELLAPGDVVLGTDVSAPFARIDRTSATQTRAWSPTPRACDALTRAGLRAPHGPGVEILRRCNDRAFNALLGSSLPDALFSSSAQDIELLLRQPPTASIAGSWLLKRAHSFAGRGRRSIRPHELSDADLQWVRASLRDGDGLQIEPRVERTLDVAIHGFVRPGHTPVIGAPTVQICDATGMWQGSRIASPNDLLDVEIGALNREAERVADALDLAGYFGPFGIDGFRWQHAAGANHFEPRCEINARYTMGWAIGMGATRPDRENET